MKPSLETSRKESGAGSRVPHTKKQLAHADASAMRKVWKSVASPLTRRMCNNKNASSNNGYNHAAGPIGSKKSSAMSAPKGPSVSSRRPTPALNRSKQPDATRDGAGGERDISPSEARRAEGEILKVFSQRPKIRRTPPRDSSCTAHAHLTGNPRGRLSDEQAPAAPEMSASSISQARNANADLACLSTTGPSTQKEVDATVNIAEMTTTVVEPEANSAPTSLRGAGSHLRDRDINTIIPRTQGKESDVSGENNFSRSATQTDGGGDPAGRLGERVTSKVFKDMATGMKTPVTETDRFDCPRGKVAAMRSRYHRGSEQPPTAKANPSASPQPATVRRSSEPKAHQAARVNPVERFSSSSVEATARRDDHSGAIDVSSKYMADNNASIEDGRAATLVVAATAKGVASEVDASGKPGPSSSFCSEGNGGEPQGTSRSREASCASSDDSREARVYRQDGGRDAPGGAGLASVENVEALNPFLVSEKVLRTPPAAQVPLVDTVIAALGLQCGEGGGRNGNHSDEPTQGGKDREAGLSMDEMALVSDPFSSYIELPRTPVEEAPSLLLGDKVGASSESGGSGMESATRSGEAGQDALPLDLSEARTQIGNLRREMACMVDRVDKQTDERERLAEIVLQAQDEAADLRKQLQDLQEKHQREENEGTGPGVGDSAAAGEVGGDAASRERELEIEAAKWESEVAKREAQEKTKDATIALEKARAELKEAKAKEWEMHGKWLEEQLLRAQEQCERDEKAMDKRQLEVKLFVAEVAAEENERKEQGIRDALVSLAGKARVMVEDVLSHQEKMVERVAGLRESVKDREQLVSGLTEKVARLEDAGRSSNEEKLEARKQLQEAKDGLVDARERAADLEARLGLLDSEHRDAQLALKHLRELVSTEKAHSGSLEQRLRETERTGDRLAEMERSRRLSAERRLEAAERARDELATASSALQAATEVERKKRLSVERRLDEAVASTVQSSESCPAEKKKEEDDPRPETLSRGGRRKEDEDEDAAVMGGIGGEGSCSESDQLQGEKARELPRMEAVGRNKCNLEMEGGGKRRVGRKRSSRQVAPSPEMVKSGQLPPARKRPRKLLGGGTTRCKTPKGKGKAIDGYSSPSTQDAAGSITPAVAVPDGDVADVRSAEVKLGVGPKSGRRASLKRKSAPAVGSVTAAGVSGEGSGVVAAGFSGVDRAVNPAFKAKKRLTSSTFAIRGKAPIRGSLFKGFVDFKKGFTVPKLKPGVSLL